MRKLIFCFLLFPVLLNAQSLEYAIFGNADDTCAVVTIGNGDLFTGLLVPDDIISDTLRFLTSLDGVTWWPVHDPTAATQLTYYVEVDTTVAYYLPLDKEVFMNFRRLRIQLDAVSSTAEDTVIVLYNDNWW